MKLRYFMLIQALLFGFAMEVHNRTVALIALAIMLSLQGSTLGYMLWTSNRELRRLKAEAKRLKAQENGICLN